MASGVNTTFRQVGIATGIAALGSIFAAAIRSHLATSLPPSLAGSAGAIVPGTPGHRPGSCRVAARR